MLGKLLPLLPLSLLAQPTLACSLSCSHQSPPVLTIPESVAVDPDLTTSPAAPPTTTIVVAAHSPTELARSAVESWPTRLTSPLIERSFGPIVPHISPHVSSLFSSAIPNQTTIFADSFDSDLSNFKVDSGAADTHGVVIQSDPLMSGNALRIEVRRDDPLASNKLRSEVIPRAVDGHEFEFGTDYFYQFRIYLPPDWETDTVSEVVAQWHGRPDFDLGESWRRPALTFAIDGEQFNLKTRSDTAQVTRNYDSGTFTELSAWSGPIERGRWIDWAFHIRWSYDNTGIIRVWKDGQHIHTHHGANTFNDRTPPFFKLGVYKPIWTRNPDRSRVEQRVLWLDDISIGILD